MNVDKNVAQNEAANLLAATQRSGDMQGFNRTETDPKESGVKYIVIFSERHRNMLINGCVECIIRNSSAKDDYEILGVALKSLKSCAITPEINDLSKLKGA